MKVILPTYTEDIGTKGLMVPSVRANLEARFNENPAYIELWIGGVREAVVYVGDLVRLLKMLG